MAKLAEAKAIRKCRQQIFDRQAVEVKNSENLGKETALNERSD
jgi:hypothetical protein